MVKNIKLTCDLFKHQIFAIHGKIVRFTLTKRRHRYAIEGKAIANARGDITITSKDGKSFRFGTQREKCECKMDKNKTKVEFRYFGRYNDSTSLCRNDVNWSLHPATATFDIGETNDTNRRI